MEQNKVKCPNCGTKIDVNEMLYHQLQEEIESKYQDKFNEKEKEQQELLSKIEQEKLKLKEGKEKLGQKVESEVKEKLKNKERELKESLKRDIEDEQSERMKMLKEELEEKTGKLKDLHKKEAEIERLKRDQSELEEKYKAEAEKKLSESLQNERERIKKSLNEEIELKFKEKDDLVEKLSEKLKDAQRRIEQGSQQAQGEAQEIAIEDYLKEHFPFDEIDEIKKGKTGADCLQTVNTTNRKNCGTIYYESKRTKNFNDDWIDKFKDDLKEKNADIGVIVTQAMPSDMDRLGQKNGVWICSFAEFKGLSFVLRDTIIKLNTALATQENKGDKMNMLYNYLTSNEFKLQIESIVSGFVEMKNDLESEKMKLTSLWKKREKQIDKVLLNTSHMYSTFKGIAGGSIETVKMLDIAEEDE